MNQLHGVNLYGTHGPVTTGVVGKDICYQCSVNGPDVYNLCACEWVTVDDTSLPMTNTTTPVMKFFTEVRHGFMLREQAEAEKFFNPKRDFKSIHNLFRPRRNLIYNDAIQIVYFFERVSSMAERRP